MKLFRKSNRGKVVPGARYRDPLLAVPLVADGVESRADSDELLQLQRDATPREGVGGWVVRFLGQKYIVRFELDERGTFFWRQIDGTVTLRDITERVAREFGVTVQEGEQGTILFVKELMKRGLIYLKMPIDAAKGHAAVSDRGRRHVA